jgi:hypothetical protein
MVRVSSWLARGIAAGLFLSGAGDLSSPPPPRLDEALHRIRSQDFAPIFELAGHRVQGYFAPEKQEKFLEEVFSLSGKWKAVTRSQASYERFLRKAFERHVFDAREFARVLDQVRADCTFVATASENRLLVALYEGYRRERPRVSFPEFKADYGRLAAELAPQVLADLGMNGVSILGAEAFTTIVVAALASAGLLGGSVAAGGAGGPWTLGVSLVVGVAVGVILDSIAGAACEDAARMEIRGHVNDLRNRIVRDVAGALEAAIVAHVRVQEECVRALFEGGRDGRMARRP